MNFKSVTLGEVSIGNKGDYGIGASAVEYSENLLTYLRITDINDDGTLNRTGMKSVNDENANKYILQPNDIVFARTGNSTGKSYFYESSDGELVYAGFLVKFSLNPLKINPKYMKYYTFSSDYKGWVNSFSTGSTRGNINAKTYANMPLKLPPREYQDLLVGTLEPLTNKIDSNYQTIKTLEEIAQAIFKHWFIDFEFPDENGNPYKSSGGKMVDSELGEIPAGWTVGNLDIFVSTTLSGDWGKEDKQGNYTKDVTIVRGADIPELKLGGNGNMPKRFILQKNFDKKYIKNNDIVVEISGGSPTQSTGRSLHVTSNLLKRISGDLICTNFCRIIRLEDEYCSFYFSKLFDSLYQKNIFFNYENGTTGIKNLDYKSVLENLPIKICTDKTLIRYFYDLSLKADEYKQSLALQNKNLEQIRDTVLPKLLSGEIKLPTEKDV